MNVSFIANESLAKSEQVHATAAAGIDSPVKLHAAVLQPPAIWPGDEKSSAPETGCLFLDFHTSQNEEHTSLSVLGVSAQPINLGERIHHYVLLLLARSKLDDVKRGLEPDSCGWIVIEQLARMLGVDNAYLNIQIHRARTQFSRALGASNTWPALIERRRGEVRLGLCWYRIVRGSRLEGEFVPGRHQVE